MLPLIYTAVNVLCDEVGNYEISENVPGEEESDDRETEENIELDDIDFPLVQYVYFSNAKTKNVTFTNTDKKLTRLTKVVLTQPPEFI